MPPLRLFLFALVTAAAFTLPRPVAADEVVVFAASSLKTALDRAAAAWTADTGHSVALAYGASPALARQIEQGAPADLFLSASPDWMDQLEAGGLIRPGSRRDLLTNRLVLIAHGRQAVPVDMAALDLAALIGPEKLAMAMVDAVPAGVYGKQALTALAQWQAVSGNVVQADSARAALALVAAGEAAYGIVFATDAAAEDDVTVIGQFPAASHAPIRYPVALTADATQAAAALLDYLSGPTARQMFEAEGFGIIPSPDAPKQP